ncbi:BMC domain-containing protein [Thermophilibacter immobilis]|jgi:ethanolamine utilization protein EutS|uniref:BMC domain-containing protein n=1 Tax=Thermophilibacter immobilis TaxID=2779519 RepID=A0A7S7M968_9ACTN|nr:BMC domain-containing protein [Thermophilibacter immobilis]QOY61056.1 BMC domain-containing protein [Thermophilibacter immobilis]
MANKLTGEGYLKKVFRDRYRGGSGQRLRLTRVSVPGREVDLAHLIGVSQRSAYENLGLHIGVHSGEDHTGEAIGLMHFTPWESTVIAADIAVKSGQVEIGFLDRFNGSLILTGPLAEVESAVTQVLGFFRDELHFDSCEFTRQ